MPFGTIYPAGEGSRSGSDQNGPDPSTKMLNLRHRLLGTEKLGRIDLRLIDLGEGHTILVEVQASNWDRMAPHRVRPNALRHARPIWRYIEAELIDRPVLPAIVYPSEPDTPGRKEEIEGILHERLIQVVWRELDIDAL